MEEPNNTKDIAQIRFENKVYEMNAKFLLKKNGIVTWFLSSPTNRFIPNFAHRNKKLFEKKAGKYQYDEKTGILKKFKTCVDGIGNYILNLQIHLS